MECVSHPWVGGASHICGLSLFSVNPPTGRSEQGLVGVTTPQQHLPDPTTVLHPPFAFLKHTNAVSDITVQHTRCVCQNVSASPPVFPLRLWHCCGRLYVKRSWQTPAVTIAGNYSKELN